MVTSVSVTARPVVLTTDVGGAAANDRCGSIDSAGKAAIPAKTLRREGVHPPNPLPFFLPAMTRPLWLPLRSTG
jgi:hypothetical protein